MLESEVVDVIGLHCEALTRRVDEPAVDGGAEHLNDQVGDAVRLRTDTFEELELGAFDVDLGEYLVQTFLPRKVVEAHHHRADRLDVVAIRELPGQARR